MLNSLTTSLNAAINILIPARCALCDTIVSSNKTLCPACWQNLPFIKAPFCPALAIPYTFTILGTDTMPLSPLARQHPPQWSQARAAVRYDGAVKKLVSNFKYHNHQELAPVMARLMHTAGSDLLAQTDLLIPIPLHTTRLLTRGFNQSGLLALHLSKETGIPLNTRTLKRTRNTIRQAELNATERTRNMRGAFATSKNALSLLKDKTITLIDDVLTTGATLNAAAKALKKHQPKDIHVLTFARRADPIETTF